MSYVQNETIRALRERKALTQKQLAEKLCISDKTIAGHHGPLQKARPRHGLRLLVTGTGCSAGGCELRQHRTIPA